MPVVVGLPFQQSAWCLVEAQAHLLNGTAVLTGPMYNLIAGPAARTNVVEGAETALCPCHPDLSFCHGVCRCPADVIPLSQHLYTKPSPSK